MMSIFYNNNAETAKEERIQQFKEIMYKQYSNICAADSIHDNTFMVFSDWLDSVGYFDVPASLKHHGNYNGGLFDHSCAVAEHLLKMWTLEGLTDLNSAKSAIIVGMFHDICKVDDYIPNDRNYLNNKSWKSNPNKMLNGHGDKSVILISNWLTLTEEEMLCIRWHMGAFDSPENWDFYNRAVKKYPSVLLTHTADMIASQVDGI